MLIPSIDLMGGRIVQLVQGEKLKLAFDDFEYWIDRFSAYPLVQLIDLDAAMRQGDNRALIEKITRRLPCQIGGGVRTPEQAQALLDLGARRVIFGSVLFRADAEQPVAVETAAAIAQTIGPKHFVASIDTKGGQVAIRGWKEQTSVTPLEALRQLEPHCGSFLYTHVDTEGTLTGFPFAVAEALRKATERELIVAGGIREQAEIDALDAIGVDAVAGMAVYSGLLPA
ncbi:MULTISPECIES: HisA/HisF-related TIM barrel protein [Acidobacterium]|uniref:Putative phosphoribosylformimino-5-aminoimidazole carboxamide ribotide isomerase n=1 Tax=Acidobacterium capsulatum (strain ATCC 51196 / DSM 11244 / BCRC 80197 / JCM 7670 / NBRC 15755 / NCIMB 13165 / 161) TaxID=240015 RepID=C1FAD7_ACIC5|nr:MULTISPECIES: HisA/HisF-related TIM barrel protein [Acidobacterium]ACO33070.1 putative phosphoribosylformimino-5-aminoimidazole carboxamide ribotide isomerase [Acidobacterium capsulatum ATCC 51196]HCT62371.1 1-(5-phosphoribosyl)-5-((5-phosphoribosylamino)methylideneamino)imidazole-4-carboxamide isomerase [Acidobacterium sp.]